MLIRSATPADISALRALERQAETAAHWAESGYDALFAPEAPHRIALVGEEAPGDICGFVIARCGTEEWEIENVVVAPQHRRCGIGDKLVEQILNAAHSAGAIAVLLEVRESNLAARQLYEQLGFAEVGRRSAYYREPVADALLLRRSTQDL